jgi:hypothetical protein
MEHVMRSRYLRSEPVHKHFNGTVTAVNLDGNSYQISYREETGRDCRLPFFTAESKEQLDRIAGSQGKPIRIKTGATGHVISFNIDGLTP